MTDHTPPGGLHRVRRPRRRAAGAALLLIAVSAALTLRADAESGNIGTAAIEIDTPNLANLYPTPTTGCGSTDFTGGTPTAVDWVKDCLPNTTDFSATNSAAQKGHLNGYRVVDGVAGNDQDIFLTGGKEQDLSTWNPGPGSVGSSKYDITQAYIANSKTDAFFGMERRGNNGTTAFDWEFNRLAPPSTSPDYVPTRSECDVLLTFEMQGSGGSGSATPFVYRYDDPDVGTGSFSCAGYSPASGYAGDTDRDGRYVLQTAASSAVTTSINNVATPAAPWGTVDSKGAWSTAPIDRFQFAEARVPLSLLGISTTDTCTDVSRYLQVRTRSSSTDTSDLKDLTKIKSFSFFAPTNPTTTVQGVCDSKFTFQSSLTTGNPTWTFSVDDPDGTSPVTLTGAPGTTVSAKTDGAGQDTWTASGLSGTVVVGGIPAGGGGNVVVTVHQSAPAGADGCAGTVQDETVTVYRGQSATTSITPRCDGKLDWSVDVDGGKPGYALTVELQHNDGTAASPVWTTYGSPVTGSNNTGQLSGTYDSSARPGSWRVHLVSVDSQTIGPDGTGCRLEVFGTATVVRPPLGVTAGKDRDGTDGATLTAALTGSATNTVSTDTVDYQWQRFDGTSWVAVPGATSSTLSYSSFTTDDTSPAAVSFAVASTEGAAAGSYKGRLWAVRLRLHVTRTTSDGLVCSADSDGVRVTMLQAVDP